MLKKSFKISARTFLTKWVKWFFYQLSNAPRNQTKKKSEKWEKNIKNRRVFLAGWRR